MASIYKFSKDTLYRKGEKVATLTEDDKIVFVGKGLEFNERQKDYARTFIFKHRKKRKMLKEEINDVDKVKISKVLTHLVGRAVPMPDIHNGYRKSNLKPLLVKYKRKIQQTKLLDKYEKAYVLKAIK